MTDDQDPREPEPLRLPIDGTLDLHAFHPRDVASLLPEYLATCRERGILDVRVIHGKGIGALRQTVRAILEKHPDVVSFRTATDASGWGATLVKLRPL